jgi:hypothetical protein
LALNGPFEGLESLPHFGALKRAKMRPGVYWHTKLV